MSLVSGRWEDDCVVGGEEIDSMAGVFGGNESRMISAVGIGSETGRIGNSVWTPLRVMFSRERPRGLTGFAGFSSIVERCFFGDTATSGSVLTGSATISQVHNIEISHSLALRMGRSGDAGLDAPSDASVSEAPGVARRLNVNASPLDWSLSSSSCTLNFRFVARTGFVTRSSVSSSDPKTDTRRRFSVGPLSLRFLRVSRLTDSAACSFSVDSCTGSSV